MSTGYVGNIEQFSFVDNDLEEYLDRVEQSYLVNKIDENLKVPFLISTAGKEFNEKVKVLVKPRFVKDYKYPDLKKLLLDHFKPTKNIRAERFKFWSRQMKESEALDDFILELKDLSSSCNYNAFLDQMLADKFILSMRDVQLQKKLLDEPMETTFSKICSTAKAFETIRKDVEDIQHQSINVNKVNASHHNPGSSGYYRRSNIRERLGPKSGSTFQYKCFECQQRGHLQRNCPQYKRKKMSGSNEKYERKNRYPRPGVNAVHEEESEESMEDVLEASVRSEDEREMMIANIGYNKRGMYTEPVYVKLVLGSKLIRMEVDCGAAATIISCSLFNELFPDSSLNKNPKTWRNLRVITGQKIEVVGTLQVDVSDKRGRKYENLMLIVVKTVVDFVPLLGRTWLDKVFPTWRESFKINALKSSFAFLKHENVFDGDYSQVIRGYEASIVMNDNTTPRFFGAYTVPYGQREAVSKEIDRLVSNNILEPVKYSQWASPIVVVGKKDGSIRICMDCRVSINAHIKTDVYPIPLIEDIFTEFVGCKYFSKVDLSGAFTQLQVSENCREFLTINTQKGLFRYTRLPFGVKTAPFIFQKTMDNILFGLKFVKPYLDDILIGGRTLEECELKVDEVFSRLSKHNVKVNQEKCVFFKKEIDYLGFKLSEEGISPTDDKMDAILHAPEPKDIHSLKAYLGLLNFYGSFIPNLSSELRPLYNLTKKNVPFTWTSECSECFKKSKDLLNNGSLLALYDPALPLGVVCDASSYGVGGVLFHIINGKECPIKFYSSTLSNAEKNYSQLEKEALAIIFTLKKCHKYVYGRYFTLFSDHKPLEFIFGEKKINSVTGARVQRWSIFLSQYNYSIKYRSGKLMGNADALSRLPLNVPTNISEADINFCSLTGDLFIDADAIRIETNKQSYLQDIINYIRTDAWPVDNKLEERIVVMKKYRSELAVADDCIRRGQRIFIPESLRETILEIIHGSHPGMVRMKSIARGSVWWPNIDRDIEFFVSACHPCQEVNSKNSPKTSEPWPKSTYPMERVHTDFCYFENKVLFVMVDTFSKWYEVKVMNKTNALELIFILKSIFCTLGLPKKMVSDNGPPFGSIEYSRFCGMNGITIPKSIPYHPSSNGSAERAAGIVKSTLTKMRRDPRTSKISLESLVAEFLFNYRNTPNTVTGKTPAELIFNFKPRTLIDSVNPTEKTRSVSAKTDRHKKSCDTKVTTSKLCVSFDAGQKVWFKLRPGKCLWSPATIRKKVSKVVYQIDCNGLIRQAHCDQLKPRVVKLPRYEVLERREGKRKAEELHKNQPDEKHRRIEQEERVRPHRIRRPNPRYINNIYFTD